jgi:hypothetical protein
MSQLSTQQPILYNLSPAEREAITLERFCADYAALLGHRATATADIQSESDRTQNFRAVRKTNRR